eukprot:11604972-Alexandrium_andersonii.AAC.1
MQHDRAEHTGADHLPGGGALPLARGDHRRARADAVLLRARAALHRARADPGAEARAVPICLDAALSHG